MRGSAEEFPDENSGGWRFALRVAGVVLPIALGAAASILSREDNYIPVAWRGAGLFRGIGLPWGWIGVAYRFHPLLFSTLGLVSLGFSAMLFLRRDRRGGASVILWSFGIGWLIAYLMTQDG